MLQRTPTGIAYDVAGHGPAVLLLHAGIADHRMWDEVADLLVATHTVVRPDLRGFGASAVPDRPFRHVDDVREVLDAAGVTSATVAGNSFGGRVALALAGAHPSRVERLVVLAASIDDWDWSAEAAEADAAEERALAGGDLATAIRINEDIWLRGPRREWSDQLRAIADRLAGPLRTALVNMAETSQFAEPDHPLVLAELSTSTTVGVGLLDLPDFVGMAHELARRILGATLVEFAEAAHLLPLEEPARVAALIV
jgi:pimeloyl-ACP methyl ester carboxylesterase